MAVNFVLHLLRHGRTRWNEQRRYLGHTDQNLDAGSLTVLGPLRERYQHAEFVKMYCSDLRRCRQTLGFVLSQTGAGLDWGVNMASSSLDTLGEAMPEVCYDSRLRELDFGEWEGKTYAELKDHPAYRSWIDDPSSVTPPDGESLMSFQIRIRHFLADLYTELEALANSLETVAAVGDTEQPEAADPGQRDVLIVTHGGVIRQMMTELTEDVKFWDLSLEPGEALRIRLSRSREGWHSVLIPPPGGHRL